MEGGGQGKKLLKNVGYQLLIIQQVTFIKFMIKLQYLLPIFVFYVLC